MSEEGTKVPEKAIFIVGAMVFFGLALAFYQPILASVQKGGEVMWEQLAGRGTPINITSQDMFNTAMLCLNERAKGCSSMDYGIWDSLDNTPLQGCPCTGDKVDGQVYTAKLILKNEKYVKIGKGFGGYKSVVYYDGSCKNRVVPFTSPVTGEDLPKRYLVLGNFKDQSYKLYNGSEVNIVARQVRFILGSQGCIEFIKGQGESS